ncbi:hypothetical protein KSP39_PZI010638 [Platanthera zijinensis]|uniref:Cytochrome b561 domain-containing protein n=1 Tax=Platanthera zijinensis TaxID=2320716 RepID=A0AAP0BJR5_9ASPA
MPIGVIISRYLRVFKSADLAWFYLHAACQSSAYIIEVAGWGVVLKLGSDSKGITYHPHRNIGIALFCLATLQGGDCRQDREQVFALYLAQPLIPEQVIIGTPGGQLTPLMVGFNSSGEEEKFPATPSKIHPPPPWSRMAFNDHKWPFSPHPSSSSSGGLKSFKRLRGVVYIFHLKETRYLTVQL